MELFLGENQQLGGKNEYFLHMNDPSEADASELCDAVSVYSITPIRRFYFGAASS